MKLLISKYHRLPDIDQHGRWAQTIMHQKKIFLNFIKMLNLMILLDFLKKKKIKILGPLSADTIFLKDNRKKFDVVVGMYHDQVLAPMKTIFGFDAINITIGLPFIRITPDHGPNYKMFGLNKSKPNSLIKAFSFVKKYVGQA